MYDADDSQLMLRKLTDECSKLKSQLKTKSSEIRLKCCRNNQMRLFEYLEERALAKLEAEVDFVDRENVLIAPNKSIVDKLEDCFEKINEESRSVVFPYVEPMNLPDFDDLISQKQRNITSMYADVKERNAELDEQIEIIDKLKVEFASKIGSNLFVVTDEFKEHIQNWISAKVRLESKRAELSHVNTVVNSALEFENARLRKTLEKLREKKIGIDEQNKKLVSRNVGVKSRIENVSNKIAKLQDSVQKLSIFVDQTTNLCNNFRLKILAFQDVLHPKSNSNNLKHYSKLSICNLLRYWSYKEMKNLWINKSQEANLLLFQTHSFRYAKYETIPDTSVNSTNERIESMIRNLVENSASISSQDEKHLDEFRQISIMFNDFLSKSHNESVHVIRSLLTNLMDLYANAKCVKLLLTQN